MIAPQRFRRKPVEVEAVQLPTYSEPNRNGIFDVVDFVDDCIAIAQWCGGDSHMMVRPDEFAYSGAPVVGPHIAMPTGTGQMYAYPGWWIIRDGDRFYSSPPDDFTTMYHPVLGASL